RVCGPPGEGHPPQCRRNSTVPEEPRLVRLGACLCHCRVPIWDTLEEVTPGRTVAFVVHPHRLSGGHLSACFCGGGGSAPQNLDFDIPEYPRGAVFLVSSPLLERG